MTISCTTSIDSKARSPTMRVSSPMSPAKSTSQSPIISRIVETRSRYTASRSTRTPFVLTFIPPCRSPRNRSAHATEELPALVVEGHPAVQHSRVVDDRHFPRPPRMETAQPERHVLDLLDHVLRDRRPVLQTHERVRLPGLLLPGDGQDVVREDVVAPPAALDHRRMEVLGAQRTALVEREGEAVLATEPRDVVRPGGVEPDLPLARLVRPDVLEPLAAEEVPGRLPEGPVHLGAVAETGLAVLLGGRDAVEEHHERPLGEVVHLPVDRQLERALPVVAAEIIVDRLDGPARRVEGAADVSAARVDHEVAREDVAEALEVLDRHVEPAEQDEARLLEHPHDVVDVQVHEPRRDRKSTRLN